VEGNGREPRAKVVIQNGDSIEGPMPLTVGFEIEEPGVYKVNVDKSDVGVVVEVTREAEA
jgi:hypothetical protein